MRFVRLLSALLLLGATAAQAQSIVERRGALKVDGNKIVDKDGKPIQLGGMSFYWSQWGAKFYNKAVVEELVNEWNSPIVRAAMAVDSSVSGYLKVPATNLASVTRVVEAAIANGIYVIIDWHEEMAIHHTQKSADFFRMMARKYGNSPNVIFEIYNEPHNQDPDLNPTWEQIKDYSQIVIAAIREHSSNLVIVGTPNWSQDVDLAAADPIDTALYGNVAYTLHFYAGTHGAGLRTKATRAMSKGIPLFVTEWGTTAADGGQLSGPSKGKVYTTESATWLAFLDANKISWCNWSLIDITEGSAALTGTPSTSGGWDTLLDLSASGQFVRAQIKARCVADPAICPFTGPAPAALPIPGRIGATRFAQSMAVTAEVDEDSLRLGSIDSGDWVVYKVNALEADTFEVRASVLVDGNGGSISVKANGGEILIPVLPVLDGSTWYTAISSGRIGLPAGVSKVEVKFLGRGFNLMKLGSLEFVKNAQRPQTVPGQIALNGYSVAPTLAGLAIFEESQPSLAMLRNGAIANYSLTTPHAGTYTLSLKFSSVSSGGQLGVRVAGGAPAKYSIAAPITGGWRNWIPTWTPIELGAGANTLFLSVSGDTGVPLFSISELRLDEGVGVRKSTIALRASLRRSGSTLRLDLPAGAFREAALVGADGRVLSSVSVEGRETAQMPAPTADMPMWIRLRGASGSQILAVPPVR